MTRLRRLLAVALAVALVPAALVPGPTISLAQLTDSSASTKALATDTLAPPTNLAATGGVDAALTWTATTDTYATGYQVHRGSVSGGPYSQVATVTPRTATSTTDTPSSGTWFYVLRSYFQNWTSVDSNQASAVVGPPTSTTGFNGCTGTSTAADTGGDGNGYESLPGNACGNDAVSATDANSGTNVTLSCTDAGKDRHRFWDFGLGVPATVSAVNGIEVRTDVGMNNNGGTTQVCIQLSWDAGTTWTAAKSVTLSGTAIATYAFGTASDTWGRTWLGSELSDANFRVRVIDVTSQPNKNFILEYIAVQVTYTP